MKTRYRYAILPLALAALAACESQAEREADALEDQVEMQAEASAVAAGGAIAALGLTEAQLLEADLVTATGADLGDVQQIRRSSSGTVDGLLVEIEDSNPDRYVMVPLDGLATQPDGDDIDIQTAMTAAELAALPDAEMMPAAATPAPAAAPAPAATPATQQ
ncbi:PRC-barrel domain containing protein [Pelagerythrobacter sp.]|uniref:PRC-barrel domain containing protein n=1 Tax=Pelagerythrobacter sp. TaxID=2800702 RepID=UPI0035AFA836